VTASGGLAQSRATTTTEAFFVYAWSPPMDEG